MVTFSREVGGRLSVDGLAIGDSGISGLLPMHAVACSGAVEARAERLPNGRFIYQRPEGGRGYETNRNKTGLHDIVRSADCMAPYRLGGSPEGRWVYATRGYVEDEHGRILLQFCARGHDITWQGEAPDPKGIVLFLAHDLATAPEYRGTYPKLYRECILPAHQGGTEVIWTSPADILHRVYRNAFAIPHAGPREMEEHLATVPAALLREKRESYKDQ